MAILTIPRKIKPPPGVGLDKSNQLNDSIEGDWAFNEAGGDTAYDGSGNGNHGTLTGYAAGETSWIAGALNFPGTNEYVETGIKINTNENWSVAGWAKVTNKVGQQFFFGAHVSNRFYAGFANDGDYFFGYGDSFKSTTPSAGIINGVWFHWALVGDNGISRYYIDGKQVDTQAYNGAGLQAASNLIGMRREPNDPYPPGSPFTGLIDQVSICDRVLKDSEIQQLYLNTWQRFQQERIVLPSLGKTYTRSDEASLPADDTDLTTAFSDSDYDDVETDNDVYVVQTAISTGDPFAMFEFKDTHSNSQGIIVVQCIAKSDRAPSVATVTLQIYNRTQTQWETLDSNNVANADTEFTLNGTQATDLDEYYDANNIVSCRVYQEAAA